MRTLKEYDVYQTAAKSIIYIEPNDCDGNEPLQATQWQKRGNQPHLRTIAVLKEDTEQYLSHLYRREGELTYIGNYPVWDDVVKIIE